MQTSDSQAISAVLQGDKSSYEALVEKHKRMVYSIAWSHLGDSDLSEDAAQETFIKAYTYLGTLREPDKFAGWLARIARNVCNSLGRRAKRENAFKQRWAVLETAEAEPYVDERESLTEQLWESFADLPALHREALTAFYIEGKSTAEAAAALGISESALRTRLHRARSALRLQLERKLEDSLADLQPSKGFTRSAMVLLPLSPKGVVGTGALAVFGKMFAGLSFALWMAAAQTLPIWGFYSLVSRVEESSLSDVPESQHIKARIRRGYRKVVIVMFAAFVVCWLLIQHVGLMTSLQIEAILYGCLTLLVVLGAYPVLRRRVNTPGVIGGVLLWAIMFAVLVAIAFLGAPIRLFGVAVFVVSIVACLTTSRTPPMLQRIGCNLFLRGAMGLGEIPEADWPLNRRLTETELRTFARLLADIRLVRDYRFRGDEITLSVFGMRKAPLAAFGIVPCGSELTIAPDGTCSATVCDADLAVLRQIIRRDVEPSELQDKACQVVRYALSCFARGDAETWLDLLSTIPAQSALIQSPASTRAHRVRLFIGVWFGIVALIQFTVHSAIVVIVAAVAGFAVAILALALNLYITRRERRSL